MFDFHIHMHSADWDKNIPQEFLEKTGAAGVDGGAIFSPAPSSCKNPNHDDSDWKIKMDSVLRLTSETPGFLPVFWINPQARDAEKQLEAAVKNGIKALKIICYTCFPREIIPFLNQVAESGLPVIFHSGVLYSWHPAADYNRPMAFEYLRDVGNLKMSMAHLSWPWTAEFTSLFGELTCAEVNYPGNYCSLYADLTPGTPAVFRRDALRQFLLTGYRNIEFRTVWGTDNRVENYSSAAALRWQKIDRILLEEISRDAEEFNIDEQRFSDLCDRIFNSNFKSFFQI